MTITSDLDIDELYAVLDAEGEAHGASRPECRSTRAAMHDYLGRHLPPRRQRRFERHMDGCAECIRAFIDIREVAWARQAVVDTVTLTTERLAGPSRLRQVTA